MADDVGIGPEKPPSISCVQKQINRFNSSSSSSAISNSSPVEKDGGLGRVKYKSIEKVNIAGQEEEKEVSEHTNKPKPSTPAQNKEEFNNKSPRLGRREEASNGNSLCQYTSEQNHRSQNNNQCSRGSSYRTHHRVAPLQMVSQQQQNRRSAEEDNYSPPPMPFHMLDESVPSGKKGQHRPIYKLQMFRFIEVAVKRLLFHLAKSAAQHKIFFTVFPVLLVSLSFIGPWYYRDRIFAFSSTPFNSFLAPGPDPTSTLGVGNQPGGYQHFSSADGRLSNNNNFNGSNPTFDAPKRTSQAEFSVLLSMKSKYSTVLTNRTLAAFARLLDQIHAISVSQSQVMGWRDMCREQCSTSPLLDSEHNNLLAITSSLRSNALLLKYPEAIWLKSAGADEERILLNNNNKSHFRLFIANLLGDVELDSDGIITRSRSLLLNIKLKESLNSHTFASFEQQLRDILANFTTNQALPSNSSSAQPTTVPEDFTINFWSVRVYVREVIGSLKDTHLKLILCFLALSLFCIVASFNNDSYQSRPFVGLQISLVLGIACLSAYSVHVVASMGQLNSVVFPALFVLCSIGVLLLSSVQASFQRFSMVALHPMEKLAFVYSWDMPQFLLSLLVLVLATVAAGLLTYTPLLQHSLFTIAAGLTALLILSLLYLTVCWFNSAKREASGLKWFQCCRQGDESFNSKYVLDYDELTSVKLHEKLTDLKPCFSRSVGRLAANYNLRTLSVALFTIFLIFSLLGGEPKMELQEDHFVPASIQEPSSSSAGSAMYLRRFHSAFEKYEHYLELVVDSPAFDYYDRRNKESLFGLLKWALEKEYATKAVSWLMDFERFQKSTIYDINPDTIVPVLSYVFLKTDQYRKYSTDIVFDKFQTQIIRSRMYLELSGKGLAKSESFVKQLLQRAHSMNLPLSVKAPYSFSLSHDLQAFSSVIWTFCWLVALLCACCLVLFSHPAICFCVGFSCLVVSMGVLGFANYFAVPANIVTLGVALIGNLFTAAITIHFCYMFSNSGLNQQANLLRMEYAFQCTLRPTILASVALVLLYSPLIICNDTPVLLHIWKMLVAIASVGLLNYCMLIPSLSVLYTFFTLIVFVLPSVVIIITDYLTACCWSVVQMCDENGACCTVEQPAESIYFVPTRGRSNALMGVDGCSRSIAGSCYLTSNYLVNSGAILPPAYDHHQRRTIMALPPPALPLPPPPMGGYIDDDLDRDGGENMLIPERLLPYYNRSAQQEQHLQSPGRRRGRSGYQIHEATDSNCENSLDSRGQKSSSRRSVHQRSQQHSQAPSSATSSRHQTPRRERRNRIDRGAEEGRTAGNNAQRRRANTPSGEQIYEEPESPADIAHSRREGQAGNGRSSKQEEGTSITSFSFTPRNSGHSATSPANKIMSKDSCPTTTNSSSLMQPNWRQYLLDGNAIGGGANSSGGRSPQGGRREAQVPPTQPYIVSSPSSNRRYHYKF